MIKYLILFIVFCENCSSVAILPNRLETKSRLKKEICGGYNYLLSSESSFQVKKGSNLFIFNDGIFEAVDECNTTSSSKKVYITIKLDQDHDNSSEIGKFLFSYPFVIGTFTILPFSAETKLKITFASAANKRILNQNRKIFVILAPVYFLFRFINYSENSKKLDAVAYEQMKLAILSFESREKIYEQ
ncbi:hypothetical protein NUH30_12570 [Leptospira sp. 85282-16]|uniref:hypothetical protein n=1 Tax=Leptospira sp. 85282-16 TaxID=2971256 RepID=UPI0021C22B4B|nr:hypothetical protein [Leptospira sp. 85282-16]MCT8334509.1 hypothetical protein [Leptospira sp. 85282-16]